MEPNENKIMLPPLSTGQFEEIYELPPFNVMPYFSSFDSFQSEFEQGTTSEGNLYGVPRSMVSLHETPIPPFLSKTFDLVDDPSLDAVISWGVTGYSFVVWDLVEFSRIILPRNFKHNNFSSFVRMLNIYGFRKIDMDKWEFANKGFIRGQRHLLKTIQRRKSVHSQQIGSSSGSSNVACRADEIERLRKERRLMMQEVVELQNQQHGIVQQVEVVKEKLVATEKRQKQILSFLAKMFKNPMVLAGLQQTREQKSIVFPRIIKKFVDVKHQDNVPGTSNSPHKEPIGKYEQPSQDTEKYEFTMDHELLHKQEPARVVSAPETIDPVLIEKATQNQQPQNTSKYFVSFHKDLVLDKSFREFSTPKAESMVAKDVWTTGSEASAGMSGSSTELWGNLSSDGLQEFGVSCGMSDIWDVSSLQRAGSFGTKKWPDKNSRYEPDSQERR